MKVTIKTLQQKTFEVDAEPQHTVFNLKEKVGSVQGEPPENLKLFYAGRTLSDDQKSVESLNIRENGYLVVMIIKRRTNDTPPSPPTFSPSLPTFTAPTPPVNPTPSASYTPSASFGTTSTTFGGTSTTSNSYGSSRPSGGPASLSDLMDEMSLYNSSMSNNPSRPFGDASAPYGNASRPFGVPPTSFNAPSYNHVPSTGSGTSEFDSNKWMSGSSMFGASEDSVKSLVDMGFEREQVLKALKSSYGNTERAVEYLTTSIPDDDEDPSPTAFRPFGNTSSFLTPRPTGMDDYTPGPFRPRPTEMVGHIEEVDPDESEEPTKSSTPEVTPAPLPAPTKDTPPDSSSSESIFPAPPLPTLPSDPIPPSISGFSSMGSRPTPFAPSSYSMPSQPGFSTPTGFGPFGGYGSSSSGENVTLESLRNDPMIQQIRELAGQNPELIAPLFGQLLQSRPGILGLISSNPEAMARLFASGPGGSGPRVEAKAQCISVTGEEKEAIERLEGMGFPKSAVIQAYFAFDKNEEAAANYLIEHCEDD